MTGLSDLAIKTDFFNDEELELQRIQFRQNYETQQQKLLRDIFDKIRSRKEIHMVLITPKQ